jgi:hypothetical protein
MIKAQVRLSIATEKDLSDWSYGKQFLETMIATDPRLTPKKIGFTEAKHAFETVESAQPYWGKITKLTLSDKGRILETSEVPSQFSWKRNAAIRHWGYADFPWRNKYGNLFYGGFGFSGTFDAKPDWLELFKTLCEMSEAAFGVLHLLTERETVMIGKTQVSPYYSSVGGMVLRIGIPNLAWATFFGAPFAKEVDAKNLRSHGYRVEGVAGGYLVLVSDKLTDILDDFPEFSRRRAALKQLFRDGLFRIKDEPDLGNDA